MPICLEPRCPTIVERGYCPDHTRDRTRLNADIRKLYKTSRWQAYRRQKRAEDPLCVECRKLGKARPWTQLDHKIPHGNDPGNFFIYENLQGLCDQHHLKKTRVGL